MTEEYVGTGKWFSRVKGYGFIQPESGLEEDVFVHFSAITPLEDDEYRNLEEGQRVRFCVEQSPKGLQATDVVRLE